MARKVVADAKTCFDDFVGKYPYLSVLRLLAEFCDVDLKAVQAWQRDEYWPGGELQVRLRCFLALAGYDVAETKKLEGPVQKLSMILGLRQIRPVEISARLWPNSTSAQTDNKSLLRLLMGVSSPTNAVRGAVGSINVDFESETRKLAKSWKERISATVEATAPQSAPRVQPVRSDLMPGVARGIQHSVVSVVALLRLALNHDGQEEVRSATNGGQSLYELRDLLAEFLPGEDN